jgi:hypothetical protein
MNNKQEKNFAVVAVTPYFCDDEEVADHIEAVVYAPATEEEGESLILKLENEIEELVKQWEDACEKNDWMEYLFCQGKNGIPKELLPAAEAYVNLGYGSEGEQVEFKVVPFNHGKFWQK